MMIDSQAPIQMWGEAVNTAMYLHQQFSNSGLIEPDTQDGCKELYETPYEMLHAFGKPVNNKLSDTTPLHHQW
jgi:hypothetical protein